MQSIHLKYATQLSIPSYKIPRWNLESNLYPNGSSRLDILLEKRVVGHLGKYGPLKVNNHDRIAWHLAPDQILPPDITVGYTEGVEALERSEDMPTQQVPISDTTCLLPGFVQVLAGPREEEEVDDVDIGHVEIAAPQHPKVNGAQQDRNVRALDRPEPLVHGGLVLKTTHRGCRRALSRQRVAVAEQCDPKQGAPCTVEPQRLDARVQGGAQLLAKPLQKVAEREQVRRFQRWRR